MTLIKKKIHPTRMAALLVLVAVLRSTANVGMESRSDGKSLSVGESVSDFPCFIACLRAARNLKFRRVMTTSGRSAKPARNGGSCRPKTQPPDLACSGDIDIIPLRGLLVSTE